MFCDRPSVKVTDDRLYCHERESQVATVATCITLIPTSISNFSHETIEFNVRIATFAVYLLRLPPTKRAVQYLK